MSIKCINEEIRQNCAIPNYPSDPPTKNMRFQKVSNAYPCTNRATESQKSASYGAQIHCTGPYPCISSHALVPTQLKDGFQLFLEGQSCPFMPNSCPNLSNL